MTHDCNCHGAGGKLSQTKVGALERPRYAPGLILEDSDLTAAVDYTRELNRLLFRSLFGCGVVCGLTVEAEEDCGLGLVVAPGLALDGCGDPLHLREPVRFKLDERDGVPRRGDPRARDFWVIACAGEKSCRPRSVVCDEDDLQELQQATRTRSTVDISVTARPPSCVCGCASYDPAGEIEGAESDDARGRALDVYARKLLPASGGEVGPYDCCSDPFGCQGPHRSDPGCASDCGCGDPCACGCCVLLAWVHWFPMEGDDESTRGWGVLHNGVRRFVRPSLLPDPLAGVDRRPGNGLQTGENGGQYGQASTAPEPRSDALATADRAPDQAAAHAVPIATKTAAGARTIGAADATTAERPQGAPETRTAEGDRPGAEQEAVARRVETQPTDSPAAASTTVPGSSPEGSTGSAKRRRGRRAAAAVVEGRG